MGISHLLMYIAMPVKDHTRNTRIISKFEGLLLTRGKSLFRTKVLGLLLQLDYYNENHNKNLDNHMHDKSILLSVRVKGVQRVDNVTEVLLQFLPSNSGVRKNV
jgi:hypothetical protein